MLQWYGPHLDKISLDILHDCLIRQYINDGPLTRELEDRIARFVGSKYAVAVTSGTAALALCLIAADIGHGDEVIVPDLTFPATANAVRLAGAMPILVDIEPKRFGINVNMVSLSITPNTKAIISVDVNGRGVEYGILEALCNEHHLKLICDSAEGLGSNYYNRKLGTFGLAGCFSFSANKIITSGQGGLIVTDDEDFRNRLLELKDQGRRYGGTGGNDQHPILGFNFKYTDLQASILLPQFDHIEQRLSSSRRRDINYFDRLSGIEGIKFPENKVSEVRQWTDILVDNRDHLLMILNDHGLGSRAFWHPLHTHTPYKDDPSKFPVSESVSKSGLWLPSRLDMTEADFDRICTVVKNGIRRESLA